MALNIYNPNLPMKQASPVGHVGPNAHVYLPVGGYSFFSGQQYTFLTGRIPQRSSRIFNGTTKPNTFRKDASYCPVSPTAL